MERIITRTASRCICHQGVFNLTKTSEEKLSEQLDEMLKRFNTQSMKILLSWKMTFSFFSG